MSLARDLQTRFERRLQPLADRLAKARLSPDHLTALSVLLAIAAGIAIVATRHDSRNLLVLPPVILFRWGLKALAGVLGRTQASQPPLPVPGSPLLRELAEPIAEVALLLPLGSVAGFPPIEAVVFAVGALLTETLGLACARVGATCRQDGPLGFPERALFLFILGLMMGLGAEPALWLRYVFHGMLLLLSATAWNRARKGIAELAKP